MVSLKIETAFMKKSDDLFFNNDRLELMDLKALEETKDFLQKSIKSVENEICKRLPVKAPSDAVSETELSVRISKEVKVEFKDKGIYRISGITREDTENLVNTRDLFNSLYKGIFKIHIKCRNTDVIIKADNIKIIHPYNSDYAQLHIIICRYDSFLEKK